jgi:hypothetical protein
MWQSEEGSSHEILYPAPTGVYPYPVFLLSLFGAPLFHPREKGIKKFFTDLLANAHANRINDASNEISHVKPLTGLNGVSSQPKWIFRRSGGQGW